MNAHEDNFEVPQKRKSTLLQPDDLEPGKWIAVHSVKGCDHSLPFFGYAAEVKAIDFPFVVIQPVGNNETAIIDIRYLNVMAVSEAFVKAQQPSQQPPQTQEGSQNLFALLNALKGNQPG